MRDSHYSRKYGMYVSGTVHMKYSTDSTKPQQVGKLIMLIKDCLIIQVSAVSSSGSRQQ